VKHVIRKIDQAIKNLYRLENQLPAESFLVTLRTPAQMVENALGGAALLVVDSSVGAEPGLEVGIYFDPEIKSLLAGFEKWPRAEWRTEQVHAFAVASEEVSHFNYLVENASRHQPVSAWEMELQGEIDRFVLAYLSQRHQRKSPSFEELFDRFFERYQWGAHLTEEKKSRYEDAHRHAKSVIAKLRPSFKDHRQWNKLIFELRKFYTASRSEKARALTK